MPLLVEIVSVQSPEDDGVTDTFVGVFGFVTDAPMVQPSPTFFAMLMTTSLASPSGTLKCNANASLTADEFD